MLTSQATASEVTWDNVRDEVTHVNPKLANIIDLISPTKDYPLIKATYLYGQHIVKDGVTCLPNENVVSVFDPKQNHLATQLHYSQIPFFLILNKAVEIFIDYKTRALPFRLYYPGSSYGIFETLDYILGNRSAARCSITAGARSILMLPKITDARGFKRLQMAYNIPESYRIKSLADHWAIFAKIAQHKNFTESWCCDVIFFTDKWFSHTNQGTGWELFHRYLLENAWDQGRTYIQRCRFNYEWQRYAEKILQRRLKVDYCLIEHVKHIIGIAIGRYAGFKPVIEDSLAAPVQGLQQAFIHEYRLKSYLPMFMHIDALMDSGSSLPVYYTLAFPTLIEGCNQKHSNSTIILDLRKIKLIFDTLTTIKTHFGKDIKLDYFHVEEDSFYGIKPSVLIPQTDPRFRLNTKHPLNAEFCTTSPFWRGCIKITNIGVTP